MRSFQNSVPEEDCLGLQELGFASFACGAQSGHLTSCSNSNLFLPLSGPQLLCPLGQGPFLPVTTLPRMSSPTCLPPEHLLQLARGKVGVGTGEGGQREAQFEGEAELALASCWEGVQQAY